MGGRFCSHGPGRYVLRDPFGVPARPGDEHRRERVQEEQSHEVEPRRGRDDAAVLNRVVVLADLERNLDPREVPPKPRAPDHVLDV